MVPCRGSRRRRERPGTGRTVPASPEFARLGSVSAAAPRDEADQSQYNQAEEREEHARRRGKAAAAKTRQVTPAGLYEARDEGDNQDTTDNALHDLSGNIFGPDDEGHARHRGQGQREQRDHRATAEPTSAAVSVARNLSEKV
jgi:hypothetical protein